MIPAQHDRHGAGTQDLANRPVQAGMAGADRRTDRGVSDVHNSQVRERIETELQMGPCAGTAYILSTSYGTRPEARPGTKRCAEIKGSAHHGDIRAGEIFRPARERHAAER